jgi:hypothetical protein
MKRCFGGKLMLANRKVVVLIIYYPLLLSAIFKFFPVESDNKAVESSNLGNGKEDGS